MIICGQKLLARNSSLCGVVLINKTVNEKSNELNHTALYFKPGVRILRLLL